ncbi:MAG: TolC family protein [Gammaproteobacteria bacterium]|jgi:outer membrane protein TolC
MFYFRSLARSLRARARGTHTRHLPAIKRSGLLTLPLLVTLLLAAGHSHAELDIDESVRLALLDDPVIAASRARSQALSDAAVADGQLPDPKLRTGLYNVPLDDFDLREDPATQLRLGIEQSFPRGDTLQYRQRQSEWLATAMQAMSEMAARKVERDVRKQFLELYYQVQAESIITKSRGLFTQLVDITRSHYATGRVSQQDVLNASLELSRLDDRTTRIRSEEDQQRAALSKWIGDAAQLPVSNQFPTLPALPLKEALAAGLPGHPEIRVETARLQAENQNINIAREQYKPGWSAGIEYRKRFGDDPAGDSRSDMMAAMVTVDLPLFTANRQDRRLAASVQEASAVELNRDERMRELQQQLNSDYANWQRLGERASLYESRLLQEATANAQASLKAYQSGVTEFTTLMRARIADLEVRLNALRIRVDRAKAEANLLYLAGATP